MFWPELDRFSVRAFDLDTVSFHRRIVFEDVVNDAPVEGVERFQFHHISPAADFFSRILCFLHQGVARLGAVSADINRHFGRGLVLLKQQAIDQILQVSQGLALPSDQTPGIFCFRVKQKAFFEMVLFDGGIEAEVMEQLFQGCFRLRGHIQGQALNVGYFFLFTGTMGAGALTAVTVLSRARVSFICAIVSKFCTVQ